MIAKIAGYLLLAILLIWAFLNPVSAADAVKFIVGGIITFASHL